jgi:hypothetical protein
VFDSAKTPVRSGKIDAPRRKGTTTGRLVSLASQFGSLNLDEK